MAVIGGTSAEILLPARTSNESALWVALAILLVASACERDRPAREETLFTLLPPDSSGVDFINRLISDDVVNILTYEYFYNGGGVGIGDFNNDGLQDVFFVGSRVPHKLFINKGRPPGAHGGFHFEDVTASSGITRDDNWSFGVSVADVNQDGLSDIYVSQGGTGNKSTYPNKLFVHQGLDSLGNPRFSEMAAQYGLADSSQSIQAVFFDFDRDDDLDLYLLNGGGFERSPNSPFPIIRDGSARNTDKLYRNDRDVERGQPFFADISAKAGILEEGFGLGISILDINEDGWLDIYATNDYLSNDLLYVNNRDGTFSERQAQYFKHTSHFAMGNDVGDVNNDGLMDIVAVDMLPEDPIRRKLMFGPTQYNKFYYSVAHGYAYQYMRNTLQLNNGNGTFSEIGQLAGIHQTDWSWAVLFADLDNDEYQDIFVTNGFGKDITDLDFVKFRSSINSAFMDASTRTRILLDSLYARPGIKVPNYAYRNNADLTFSKTSSEWGFDQPTYSSGAAYADFDNDGDLDLVVNNIDEVAHVYRNTQREKNGPATNYLRVRLVGPAQNKSGTGSKVRISYNGKNQYRIKSVVRGFQSSVEDPLHFGLGKNDIVDTVEVVWPDGNTSIEIAVKANQLIEIDHRNRIDFPRKKINNATIFKEVDARLIPYVHRENDFVDFNHEPLLPYKLSQEGPGIAVADVNGDGLEDLFIGGALLTPGRLLIQKKNGTFVGSELAAADREREDMGCLFFDADDDDDADLYVVSGGNEYNPAHRHYQDRLYFNDGKGAFKKDEAALPNTLSSGSCVVAADYDHDGDLDLFVGGRVLPTAYPTAPRSYILRNNGKGAFEDATQAVAMELLTPGMVTSALWTDFNNDSWMDLVVAGEYMPVSFFRNDTGMRFVPVTGTGLENSEGWWRSLTAGDLDNDGDTDYIAGNFGLNTHYRATPDEPINVAFKDFDRNGAVEAITSYYEGGINYPAPSMDVLISQLPVLKKEILYHSAYARTSTTRLLAIAGESGVGILNCKTLQSTCIENLGNGKFQLRPLPLEMQFAPVYGVLTGDVNFDGYLDLIAVGNSYAPEVVTGRCDAFTGVVMLGDGGFRFKPVPVVQSGFSADGDSKGIARLITAGNDPLVIVTQNNDSLKIFREPPRAGDKHVALEKTEVTALVAYTNGGQNRIEIGYGSGYLSQSSRSITITPLVRKVELFDHAGKLTRALEF